jgi:hypothetical protein
VPSDRILAVIVVSLMFFRSPGWGDFAMNSRLCNGGKSILLNQG